MIRLVTGLLFLLLITIIPFLIWGDQIEGLFDPTGVSEFLQSWGEWGWLAGIVLIISDIVLPIPASSIMATMGIIYGPVVGGLISLAGTSGAGLIGYGVCRLVPQVASARMVGDENYKATVTLFEKWGGWLVAASRWLPVLPETVSFVAGIARMPFLNFVIALFCGSIPLAFTYASMGFLGADRPLLTIGLAASLPLVLWLFAKPLLVYQSGKNG